MLPPEGDAQVIVVKSRKPEQSCSHQMQSFECRHKLSIRGDFIINNVASNIIGILWVSLIRFQKQN